MILWLHTLRNTCSKVSTNLKNSSINLSLPFRGFLSPLVEWHERPRWCWGLYILMTQICMTLKVGFPQLLTDSWTGEADSGPGQVTYLPNSARDLSVLIVAMCSPPIHFLITSDTCLAFTLRRDSSGNDFVIPKCWGLLWVLCMFFFKRDFCNFGSAKKFPFTSVASSCLSLCLLLSFLDSLVLLYLKCDAPWVPTSISSFFTPFLLSCAIYPHGKISHMPAFQICISKQDLPPKLQNFFNQLATWQSHWYFKHGRSKVEFLIQNALLLNSLSGWKATILILTFAVYPTLRLQTTTIHKCRII